MDANLKAFLWIVLGAAIAFAFGRVAKGRDRKSDAEQKDLERQIVQSAERNKRITELESQMAVLKAEAVPIAAAFQAMLIAKMTHLHEPVTDALLAKSKLPSILTLEETDLLVKQLKGRMVDMDSEIDDSERIAAEIFFQVMEMAKLEAEGLEKGKVETVLVSQPAVSPKAPSGEPEEDKK